MRPIETNLQYLEAMTDELEPYILGSELFWPLSRDRQPHQPPLPRMTIGNLLTTLGQLEASREKLSPAQSAKYQKLSAIWQHTRQKWPVGLERKAMVEMRSRLNLWRAYLTELEQQGNRAGVYPHEVRNRLKFQLLADLVGEREAAESYVQAMQPLDAQLRSIFSPGRFQWHSDLKKIYPKEMYWYLYGEPRSDR